MLVIITFLLVHWYLSAFCQSFFLHRYGAHSMFTMPRFWDRFFYLLTYVSQGSSFLNPAPTRCSTACTTSIATLTRTRTRHTSSRMCSA